MKTPKLPPNAADYGYRKDEAKILSSVPWELRRFAACMSDGWWMESERLENTGATVDEIIRANNYIRAWADWSAKHAPVTKTV